MGLKSKIEYHRNKSNYSDEPIRAGGVEVGELAGRIYLFLLERGREDYKRAVKHRVLNSENTTTANILK